MNQLLRHATLAVGLAVIAWVGAGYVLTNPLALAITVLIGAFWAMGVRELQRFRQTSAELGLAVDALSQPPAGLAVWLERVPAGLRNAVRRRVEGEAVGLPAPALAATLAGLLVLLGMLGTFLGMILTLRGTGAALETATDLVAVRNSLIAPVKGLGLAFGTSVAGVAGSATLGLLSALARRERVAVAQRLDAAIATTLRRFSQAAQREESLGLLQRQADAMPALVERLDAMMAALERQQESSNARLLASQERFQAEAGAAYAGLAQSVDRTLQASLTEGARIAGETIRPVAEATLAGIARETASLHATLAAAMQGQLEQLAARFETSTAAVAGTWQTLLERHARAGDDLAGALAASHERFAQTFEARSAALVEGVSQGHVRWQDDMAAALAGLARDTASMHKTMADAAASQVDGVAARLDAAVQRVTQAWGEALAGHERANARMSGETAQSLTTAAAAFEQHSTALLRSVQLAHAELQSDAAMRDQRRIDTMAQSLEAMAASLQQQWAQAGAQSLDQQQRVVETMERTARDITVQAETQARATIAEIARLVQAASEAPRAAAQVISELRQKLADSMARDNTMLDERARILETLGTLLEGVNRAAGEQRGAIDALVSSSAEVLERVAERFHERVQADAGQLVEVAAQVTGGAAEVASLGEAFGFAVQLFSESNDKLAAHLERIDGALNAQMARSDEQLAYYVAQAREVIDLSILSQKQIIEELQRLAGRQAAEALA
jgi:hypothetical protein